MALPRNYALALATAVLATIIFLFTPAPAKSDVEPPTVADVRAERASLIADAIQNVEGRCAPGQSGEQGCFQYLPGTWRAYSKEIAGEVLPQTKENERMVTEGMIRKWLDDGVSERGIFLIWNQGTPGPDCRKGVNRHGVRYDSCDYAARGTAYLATSSWASLSTP